MILNNETKETEFFVGRHKRGRKQGKFLENQKFGKILVLELVGITKQGKRVWKCQCDCGKIKNIAGTQLLSGRTKSCGGYAHRKTSLPPGESNFNVLFRTYQRNAEDRGYSFELSKDEFRFLTKQNCHYCNIIPSTIHYNGRSMGPYIYNGIDRKINTIGYTKENSISCCSDCNTIKMTLDYNDFLKKIELIYNNRIKSE